MDKQEIFNKVWEGLKSQGFRRSLSDSGISCRYRGIANMKCAAGWLIRDEDYQPDFEGWTITSIGKPELRLSNPVRDYFESKGFDEDSLNFIYLLQRTHDLHEVPYEMETALVKFANEHDLKLPENTN